MRERKHRGPFVITVGGKEYFLCKEEDSNQPFFTTDISSQNGVQQISFPVGYFAEIVDGEPVLKSTS